MENNVHSIENIPEKVLYFFEKLLENEIEIEFVDSFPNNNNVHILENQMIGVNISAILRQISLIQDSVISSDLLKVSSTIEDIPCDGVTRIITAFSDIEHVFILFRKYTIRSDFVCDYYMAHHIFASNSSYFGAGIGLSLGGMLFLGAAIGALPLMITLGSSILATLGMGAVGISFII